MSAPSEPVHGEAAHGGSMRNRVARARGLGSAKGGVHHWWAQRVSALGLIPLSIWFIGGLVAHAGADHAAIVQWLGSPFTVGALSLMIIAAFYHGSLSFQVVIEDYAPNKVAKVTLVLLVQFAAFALATAGILALLDIAFVG